VLGAKPELGSTFVSTEEQWGKDLVVVLSHTLWMQAFGGDRGIVGKTITLNARPRTVIGVLPAEFSSVDSKVQLWVPASLRPEFPVDRYDRFLHVIARLKTGVTLQQGQADMNTIAAFWQRSVSTAYFPTPSRNVPMKSVYEWHSAPCTGRCYGTLWVKD
jgi:hypothetical protein